MAPKIERSSESLGEDREDRREKIELFESLEHIRQLAEYNANSKIDTEEKLKLFLKSWWSKQYNRPLKDPLLLSYTIEELMYEFYNFIERQKSLASQLEDGDDKIEEDVKKAALDWAEQEELKELDMLQSQAAEQPEKSGLTKDDIKWMEDKMKEAKEVHGESFGEDINEDFS